MSNKTSLRTLIDLIKHKGGLTQGEIAERANYKRTYLSQALKMKNPPEKLLTKLKLTFSDILEHGSNNIAPKKEGKFGQENGLTIDPDHISDLRDFNAHLKKQIELNSVEIEEKLAAILAYQKTFYHILAKLTAKVEKSSPGSVLSDMDKLLAGAFRDIRKTNISGVDNGTKA